MSSPLILSRVVDEPTYSQKRVTFILNVFEYTMRCAREAATEVVESHCTISPSQVASPSLNLRLRTLLRHGDFCELRRKGRSGSGLPAVGHVVPSTVRSINEGKDASV